mmetsp:Transcript_4926/g.12296  ORF Transcript_4926/g.12296 Transcript_4926/m.12296 type:complete len:573 (-) Transcript_4926:2608-4326(-)|eukprot:CAMPEP_0178993506 /NCGR_PEP_ID=MMETSP0795-20121207/6739_1 /TAXON_ID=88552 /ORGANISM="Amoebophrya sp., Strain Ameob2" /LENGTH=572 /DNA_ID=CAMNT_0020685569 /DNA_START=1145 /DNA_END=2863 /DNA_ORIENTATION=-
MATVASGLGSGMEEPSIDDLLRGIEAGHPQKSKAQRKRDKKKQMKAEGADCAADVSAPAPPINKIPAPINKMKAAAPSAVVDDLRRILQTPSKTVPLKTSSSSWTTARDHPGGKGGFDSDCECECEGEDDSFEDNSFDRTASTSSTCTSSTSYAAMQMMRGSAGGRTTYNGAKTESSPAKASSSPSGIGIDSRAVTASITENELDSLLHKGNKLRDGSLLEEKHSSPPVLQSGRFFPHETENLMADGVEERAREGREPSLLELAEIRPETICEKKPDELLDELRSSDVGENAATTVVFRRASFVGQVGGSCGRGEAIVDELLAAELNRRRLAEERQKPEQDDDKSVEELDAPLSSTASTATAVTFVSKASKEAATAAAPASRKEKKEKPQVVFHVDVKANSPESLSSELQAAVSETKTLFDSEFEEDFNSQVSKRGGYRLTIMCEKNQPHDVCSFAMYKINPKEKCLSIAHVAVPHTKRRLGYGKAMMKWVIAYAKKQPRSNVQFLALSSMPGSIKFHQSLGFKKEGKKFGGAAGLSGQGGNTEGAKPEGADDGVEYAEGQVYMTYPIKGGR